MIKISPNLIDIGVINKEIQHTIFRKNTNRVNIVLGLLFIFLVLLFVYFGINSTKNEEVNIDSSIDIQENYPEEYKEDYQESYQQDNIYEQEDFITPLDYSSNAYELALMS
jgi:hypothetical protein